jgi:hypothetical protein
MLTMVLTGDDRKLETFVNHLQGQPCMEVIEMSKEKRRIKLVFTTNLLNSSQSKVSHVLLTTACGKTIEIELLDLVETVDGNIRKVVGNSYDIFAAPRRG